MTDTDREELKEQLRAMSAGRGDGIDIDTPFHWVVEDLKLPVLFFEHLSELLPPDSILYVEGTSIAADLAAFYSSHDRVTGLRSSPEPPAPARCRRRPAS